MRNLKLLVVLLAVGSLSFVSCKKDYSCTCTTTVGGISTTKVHDLPKQRYPDANDACDRFEADANNNSIGTTNCHL